MSRFFAIILTFQRGPLLSVGQQKGFHDFNCWNLQELGSIKSTVSHDFCGNDSENDVRDM